MEFYSKIFTENFRRKNLEKILRENARKSAQITLFHY